MKLKNMWKRFWTLDVHNHEGFTLVELIIVIAILAILSTGAIAGYSAYVTKANKTADQSMIAEIKTVLQLKAYSEGVSNADFVILTQNGAEPGGEFVTEALYDAYGANWADALKLKSDDWAAGAFLVNVQDAELIANSTFLTTSKPEGLMQAITNLTGAAGSAISGYAGDVAAKLESLGMGAVADKLEATGLQPGTAEYNTAVSNLLVGQFAGAMSGQTVADVQNDPLAGTALMYATLFAYCETLPGDTGKNTMATINNYLSTRTDMNDLKKDAFAEYINSQMDSEFVEGFVAYGADQGAADMEATLKIMGAVSNISGNYTSAGDLSNANLYASDTISQQLNEYVGAIKAVAQMDPALRAKLQNLGANDIAVVITVSKDGIVA